MTLIPQREDPTIEALKRAYVEANEAREVRDYLGASAIGEPCARKIWYRYNHYPEPPMNFQSVSAINSGHHGEAEMARRLRLLPFIDLWTHDENGKQFERVALDGKFRCHPDGIIRGLLQAPKTLHIWENKDCGQKKFDEFKAVKMKFGEKAALKNWNETYYAQAQVNMHLFEMDRHYLTVGLAGGRDILSCRTEYVPEEAARYLDRAARIISAQSEPARISDKPDFWICRFCPFQEICHA